MRKPGTCLGALLGVLVAAGPAPAVGVDSVRVLLDLPTTTVRAHGILEVPVCIEDGAADVLSYALRLRYDRRVLKLREIRGGNFSGFDAPPVVGPGSDRPGQKNFTANNSLFLATPDSFNVATAVFEVVGEPGSRGSIRIGRTKWGDVTVRGTYRRARYVKFPRAVYVDVVQ